MRQTDTLVLGAGIVGICTAAMLQQAGEQVVLVDRLGPGEGTSMGNAGLIERASLRPYPFPRKFKEFLAHASNQGIHAHYDMRYALFNVWPLLQYWWYSAPSRYKTIIRQAIPLLEQSVVMHTKLAQASGASDLLHASGLIKLARKPSTLDAMLEEAEKLRPYGLKIEVLDAEKLHAKEPTLTQGVAIGGLHLHDPLNVRDPLDLSRAHARYFQQLGGKFHHGDAFNLHRTNQSWEVLTDAGLIRAPRVVMCLGAYTNQALRPWKLQFPLIMKRGYHMHHAMDKNSPLHHTIYDVDGGFVLARMHTRLRITTGAQFASPDAPPNPIQLERCMPHVAALFPIGQALDTQPWMGIRSCLPDMLPVVGHAPGRLGQQGMWLHFGHSHHGLTLAPVTATLLAQCMLGHTPFTNPSPYAATRF